MNKEEMDSFVKENMDEFKEQINDMHNHFPFNLANELLSNNQYQHCDIQKLYNAINELDPKYRAALILRYKYKYTYKRIGEALGYSAGYGSFIIPKILGILRRNYDIYVYDKNYIISCIKEYNHEIDNLKMDKDKFKKYIDCLMDQVLRDHPNMSKIYLISKIEDAYKLMNTSISDLNLSNRAYNALNTNYKNLYELSYITIEELWETRRLGADTIKEIVDKLYYNGIYIEHKTIKNIETGRVRYISKNDKTNYKSWKLI